MSNINFFLQIFSLMAVMPVLVLVLISYIKYKKITIIFYGLFMLGISSFIMTNLILDYFFLLDIPEKPLFVNILNRFFANFGPLAFFISGPVLVHLFFGLRIREVAIISSSLAFISIAAGLIRPDVDMYFFWIIIISVSLYMTVVCLCKYSTIGDQVLRTAIRTALILTSLNILFLVIPLFPYELLYDISTMGTSLFFLIFNGLNILFCINFFTQEPYITDSGISDSFINKFKITPRENEIITLLMDGLSVKGLGEALYISPKTVSNHIHNIYQKTSVKNRIQLINLIKSRS